MPIDRAMRGAGETWRRRVRDIEVAECGAGWHPAADWQSAPGAALAQIEQASTFMSRTRRTTGGGQFRARIG